MKIAVIGASGNAGSRITAELARRGHAVTAIARNPEKIAPQANVTATKGDLMDQAALPGCSPAMMPQSARSTFSPAIRPS